MTIRKDNKLLLDELCRRWGCDWDDIFDLAITGQLPLWIELFDVELVSRGKKGKISKQSCSRAEVRPLPAELAQLKGRGEAMMIAFELPCLDAEGKAVVATNSVGEEMGDASMIGFKPANLFIYLQDVLVFEKQHGLEVEATSVEPEEVGQVPSTPVLPAPPLQNARDIEQHAPELHVALQCWQALWGAADAAEKKLRRKSVKKWIRKQYPLTTEAAVERIARVVCPSRKKKKG
ncbi:hypothetical protein [Desulfobulbus alkaliphilus]|uniref:hypothetical protein n=1 Tax=Desulfobulbus alkaliphilus TaxID=869814 RepID=UPI0019647D49|nr:hypothetical protein [Desulfobulbus alkaliphilus]MBM9536209.1 hypothetical protein [Desulfobulbus alkaliphilus]